MPKLLRVVKVWAWPADKASASARIVTLLSWVWGAWSPRMVMSCVSMFFLSIAEPSSDTFSLRHFVCPGSSFPLRVGWLVIVNQGEIPWGKAQTKLSDRRSVGASEMIGLEDRC